MDLDAKNKLKASLELVRKLRAQDQIADPEYHKMLVCIAYQYADEGEMNEATAILSGIPLSYYRDVQFQQMMDDESYYTIGCAVAELLVKYGIVPQEVVKPNMPGAKA